MHHAAERVHAVHVKVLQSAPVVIGCDDAAALHCSDEISSLSGGRRELTILSSASAGALLTLSNAVVGDARLRLPGPQLVPRRVEGRDERTRS